MDFRVLGPLEASERGRRVPLGGPKQRAVLAHLLIRANRVVSTDRLIDDVWGGEPPEAARNALQSYVSRLRGTLRDGARIEGRPPGYVLRVDPDRIDAHRFEALVGQGRRALGEDPEAALRSFEQALELWRGTPLADLSDELSLRAEIGRLEELRLAALEDRVAAALALGRHGELVAELESLVEEHPLRERLWGHLMVALYRSGRQADALAAYQRARRLLADELGLEPSPELRALQGRILRQDPSLEPQAQRLRGYRLLGEIGAGSFGVVHRALQPHVGREVAVKVINPTLANDARFVRRFEAEAQLVARLEHPRIVPLYDYWRDPDGAYLVMRLLRGGNLKRELEAGPLEAERAVTLVGQVAAGLAVAHRQGVVHRDVKPANILLDEEGDAYLSDFGIATDVATEVAPPSPDTIAYVSPEQARGEPATPRTDVYALGVVLREALAGAGVAPPLAQVIEQATAPDPAERYADAEALARALASLPTADAAARLPIPARNPYKGLRPFDEADAADYFGREALVERLVGRLGDGARFLALVGASGSGKSSAVRAGLFPALRRDVVPGSSDWFLVEMSPGAEPLEELEEALRRIAVDSPPTLTGPRHSDVLLFVDQLEELFTLVEDPDRRARFLGLLAAAATDAANRVRVVVALRADFYDRPLEHPQLAPLLRSGVETLVPPSPEELERAIAKPAARVAVACEPGLVGEVVADVSGRAGALPLLQYALTELFDRRQAGVMTLAAYRELGGLGGAVARRADKLWEQASERGQEAARQLFLRLAALGDADAETRRRVSRAELASLEVDQGALEDVIEAFGRHRLLSFDRDPQTRAPTVEVAHEALLRAWRRLRNWIEEARGDVQMRGRLAAAASEWHNSGRDPSFLLGGARLELFDAWAQSSSLVLARLEREYLEASRERREAARAEEEARRAREAALEQRSRRRLRALVAVLTVAALVAGALSIFAFDQREEARAEAARAERGARIATARELASAALANLDDDPERSILLALEGVEITRSSDGTVLREAEEALHAAVQASRVVLAVPGSSGMDRGTAVQFGPDGKRLVTTNGRTATIWDASTGQELVTLSGHSGRVASVAFSPDGSRLATGGPDRTARLWDAATGVELMTFSGHRSALMELVFSPDGDRLATTEFDGGATVWDTRTGRRIVHMPAAGLVTGLAFSPDATRLVTGNGAVAVWEVAAGRQLQRLEFQAFDVAYSPDGSLLAAAGGDGVATVWDSESGEEIISVSGHSGIVTDVEFGTDGKRLATAGHDGTVRLWDVESGSELLVLSGQGGVVDAITLSPDGTRVAACCGDGRALVWDVTPRGSREVLSLPAHEGTVFNVAYSPDGRRLATAGSDGAARIWNAADGRELLALERHGAPVSDVVFSPDGRHLATAGFDGTARLWDASTGSERSILRGHTAPVWGVSFAPDGRRLATTGEDMTARVWDTAAGKELLKFHAHEDFIWDIAYSPDGARFVTVSNDAVPRVWDAASGRMLGKLEGHDGNIVELDFSPDGALVATAGFDGTARVWNVANGEAVRALTGHAGAVLDVEFSADGERLATASLDGTAKLWDAGTGREVLTLAVSDAGTGRIAFSPDATRLAVADMAGAVRVYFLQVDDLVDLARERVTRTLTDAECRQYLHRDRCPG